jgi:recyclin-1
MGEAVDGIDFAAMDSFMNHVLAIVAREGRTIAKVFPQDSDVLVQFADRIANDVVGCSRQRFGIGSVAWSELC